MWARYANLRSPFSRLVRDHGLFAVEDIREERDATLEVLEQTAR